MGAPTAVYGAQSSRQTGPVVSVPFSPWVVLGCCGAMGMVLTGTRIGAVPDPHLALWWFSLPSGGGPVDSVGFYVSVAVLVAAWVGVGRAALAGELSLMRAWVVLAAWGLPLLLGPPLFSRDLYSYVAQGLLTHHGLESLRRRPVRARPRTPPVRCGHRVAGHHLALRAALRGVQQGGGRRSRRHPSSVQLIAYRVLELVGVALVMVSLPRLARHLGTDPGHRPVARGPQSVGPVQLRGLGPQRRPHGRADGGRGDASASPVGCSPGLVLCALAATVKLPAAAAVAFLAADGMQAVAGARRWRVVGLAAGPCWWRCSSG